MAYLHSGTGLSGTDCNLFNQVRLMAVAREPVLSWEEIAHRIGLDDDDVPGLLAWFITFRLPPAPHIIPAVGGEPRDPELRAELRRLRDRERSLVSVAGESPRQLARVQQRIQSLERTR